MNFTMISKVHIKVIKYLRRKGVLKELTQYVKFIRYKLRAQHHIRPSVLVHPLKRISGTRTYANTYVRRTVLYFLPTFDLQHVLHVPTYLHRLLYTESYLLLVVRSIYACLVLRPTLRTILRRLIVLALIFLFASHTLTSPTVVPVHNDLVQFKLGVRALVHTSVRECKDSFCILDIRNFRNVIKRFPTRSAYESTTVHNDTYKKLANLIHSAKSQTTVCNKDASTRARTFLHEKCAIFHIGITTCPNGGFGPEFEYRYHNAGHRLHIFNLNSRFKVLNKKLELVQVKDFSSRKFLQI